MNRATLEWRSQRRLHELRQDNTSVTVVAPESWPDWVEAFANLFAPANLLALLAQQVMATKQTPNQSVDQYSLSVTSLVTRLLDEVKRSAPVTESPEAYAWEKLKIEVFEHGLLPAIKVEHLREDPARSFADAHDRAKKHSLSSLRSANLEGVLVDFPPVD